jgi:hypothetical protein
MAHTTGSFQTWKPEIDAYITDEESNLPMGSFSEIFSVDSTNRLSVNEVTDSGFGPMDEVGEQGDAVEDAALEGYTYNYIRKNFRKKAIFSKVLMDTDQSGEIEKRARDLPRAVKYSRELNIWSMVRNAWSQSYLFGDGKSLVSTAHPRKDGGTSQTNTFNSGVQKTLTYDNALELQDVLLSLVSNTGNLMNVAAPGRNKCLVVGTYLREQAFQIAGVEGAEKEPDTMDNNSNYFRKGDKFDVLVVDWLTYEAAKQAGETTVAKTSASNYWDTMWGIVDRDLAKRYFKVKEQKGYPYYDDDINKDNESLIKFAYDAYTFGNTAYYPIALSKGDATTFSS